MKTMYTRDTINTFVRGLDVRAKTLTPTQLDNVINRGYAELMTTSKKLFSNEDVVNLAAYYTGGELKLTIDVEADCTEIYDVYTTIEGEVANKSVCEDIIQGIGICRDNDVAYRDNRYIGRVHLDLGASSNTYDNLVVKYYFTPNATTADIYMDSQVYLAFTDAMWAALLYFFKDIEGEAQKRASMQRTSKSITQEPEDVPDIGRAIFGRM